MPGKAKTASPVQGAEAADPKLIDHVVTQEDLDKNPELVEAGVMVGETIQIPEKSEAPVPSEDAPEWVQTILDSNQAVIASNATLIDAFEQFKDMARRNVGNYESKLRGVQEQAIEFDEDAEYVVSEGKSFVDKHDITKRYEAGQDVTHFGAERLARLLAQGLIEEA